MIKKINEADRHTLRKFWYEYPKVFEEKYSRAMILDEIGWAIIDTLLRWKPEGLRYQALLTNVKTSVGAYEVKEQERSQISPSLKRKNILSCLTFTSQVNSHSAINVVSIETPSH